MALHELLDRILRYHNDDRAMKRGGDGPVIVYSWPAGPRALPPVADAGAAGRVLHLGFRFSAKAEPWTITVRHHSPTGHALRPKIPETGQGSFLFRVPAHYEYAPLVECEIVDDNSLLGLRAIRIVEDYEIVGSRQDLFSHIHDLLHE